MNRIGIGGSIALFLGRDLALAYEFCCRVWHDVLGAVLIGLGY